MSRHHFESLASATDLAVQNWHVEWEPAQPITIDAKGKLAFPPQPRRAGVYRFRFLGSNQVTEATYTGEAQDRRQRMAQYRYPGVSQRTNRRLNARMIEFLAAPDKEVVLEIVSLAGDGCASLDLKSKADRRRLEQFVVRLSPAISLNVK